LRYLKYAIPKTLNDNSADVTRRLHELPSKYSYSFYNLFES